jgi:hypothetical protein
MQEIALEVTAATDMQGRNFSLFILAEPEAAVTFALRDDTLGDNRLFKVRAGEHLIVKCS